MASKKGMAVAMGLGLGALALLLMGRKSEAAQPPAVPPPVPGAPPPPPGPAAGRYSWPAGFDVRHAVIQAGLRHGLPDWLAPATAVAEDGLRMPPTAPNECDRYGCTFYPMGIKSATIATALGQGGSWEGNPARYDAIGLDLPAQIDAAARLLKTLWARAAGIALSEEQAAHLVRVGWQSGTVPAGGRLPDWYTNARDGFMVHWTQAVASAGGPDIRAAPGGMGGVAGGMGINPSIVLLSLAVERARRQATECRRRGHGDVAGQLEAFAAQAMRINNGPKPLTAAQVDAWTTWLDGVIAEAAQRCAAEDTLLSRMVISATTPPRRANRAIAGAHSRNCSTGRRL